MSTTEYCVICGDWATPPTLDIQVDEGLPEDQILATEDVAPSSADTHSINLHDMPCGNHAICATCFVQAAENAVEQERNYPIPCGDRECGNHPQSLIVLILQDDHPELLANYLAKSEEYETPRATRVYCASKQCASTRGVSPLLNTEIRGGGRHVRCPHCNTVTCIACKDAMTVDEGHHECSAGEQEKSIRDYLDSIPEELRWLSQRCYRCRVIVEKTEACNHMTCFCGAEFCLICGGKWNGLEACGNGCCKVGHELWDPDNGEGGNEDYDDDDYEDRFDGIGMDPDGYDREGFDHLGFDRDGFDVEGRDGDGYDRLGWDREGFDRNRTSFTGLAYNVYDPVGYDDEEDDDIWLEDVEGYDPWGYDALGYDVNGIDRMGRDREGFDDEGRDREGFDREGRDGRGRDRRGYDVSGYNDYGWNQHHRNINNEIAPGYQLTSDGNVRRVLRLPFAAPEVFGCQHAFMFTRWSSTCGVCSFGCSRFHYHCHLCGGNLCDYCNSAHSWNRPGLQDRLRARIPFPGDDDFGLIDLFTVEKHETTFYIAEMFAIVENQGEQRLIGEVVMIQGGTDMLED
nr:hypothetical protein B0A51_08991 [Rachicladosporium sp. CCFEE 5018]